MRLRRVVRSAAPTRALLGCVVGVDTDGPWVALSFDDGPDPRTTPALLEVLAAHGVRVTFFVLAERAAAMPELVAAIRRDGHELALHGYDHRSLLDLRRRRRSLLRARTVVEQLSGTRLRWFRPPYGFLDLRSLVAIRTAGLVPVAWSADGDDWTDIEPGEVAERLHAELHPGGIALLHERTEPWSGAPPPELDRVEVLVRTLTLARRRGLAVVPVGELLRCGPVRREVRFWRPVGPPAAAVPGLGPAGTGVGE